VRPDSGAFLVLPARTGLKPHNTNHHHDAPNRRERAWNFSGSRFFVFHIRNEALCTMGTFDNAASAKTGASIRNNHADEIGGAAGASPSVTSPVYSHADQISGFNPGLTSFSPAAPISYAEDIKKLDPSKSPFLNPSQAIQTDPLDAFGGIGKPVPPSGRTTPQLTEQLPPPPPLPPRPTALDAFGGTGAPIQPVGGGNAPENAELLARQNADKLKQAKAQQRHQNDLADERAKQARAEATAAARMTRMQTEQAEQTSQQAANADDLTSSRHSRESGNPDNRSNTLDPRLRGDDGWGHESANKQTTEPAGHPGLSDAAISSQQRMVTALGKIRGVGDLPTITIDAASNYGDKGVYEVADLIHRTTKADITQGRELLDKTTAGLSPERADRLHATVASLAMNDDPTNSLTVSKPDYTDAKSNIKTAPAHPDSMQQNPIKEPEWNNKPSEQVYDGTNSFTVDGPIKIDPKSMTIGVDGIRYEVDWYTLDKNGNVVPEWRSDSHQPQHGGGYILPGASKSKIHYPLIPSKHGYRVIIRIPPQPDYSGNSAGTYLDIYSSKGSRLDKMTK
jgi:hypothetical protein